MLSSVLRLRVLLPWLPQYLAGIILILAAILKLSAQIKSDQPFEAFGPWLQISAEAILGTWLLSGFHSSAARFIAAALFALFAAYNAFRAALGETTCNCFGDAPISPWWTLALDTLLTLGLIASAPLFLTSRTQRTIAALASVALISLALLLGWLWPAPPPSSFPTWLTTPHHRQQLRPPTTDWISRPWPLLPHIQTDQRLDQGSWLILLYHHDCPACQAALKTLCDTLTAASPPERPYLPIPDSSPASPSPLHYAIVELPPFGPPLNLPPAVQQSLHLARLTTQSPLHLPLPLLLYLENGIVRRLVDPLGDPSALVAKPDQLNPPPTH